MEINVLLKIIKSENRRKNKILFSKKEINVDIFLTLGSLSESIKIGVISYRYKWRDFDVLLCHVQRHGAYPIYQSRQKGRRRYPLPPDQSLIRPETPLFPIYEKMYCQMLFHGLMEFYIFSTWFFVDLLLPIREVIVKYIFHTLHLKGLGEVLINCYTTIWGWKKQNHSINYSLF